RTADDGRLGAVLRRVALAGLAAASLAGVAVWRDVGLIDRAFADYATRPGERLSAQLQDGTRLQLDGDTAIRTQFSAAARDVVVLRGRVWFEVSPDSARPFVVHAGDLEARALGTAFEVDAVAGSVAVGHGRVLAAAHGDRQAPVALAAGERLELGADGRLGPRETGDPSTLFAWRRGLLVLDAAPLRAVAGELGRMTAGRVVFAGAGIAEMRLSGSFSADEPEAVLAAMRSALGLKTATAPGFATVIYR
ncbi:FecR family protein, partial [Methylopila musalis]